MNPELKCAKCDGEMELGHIPDYVTLMAVQPPVWVRGPLRKGFFGQNVNMRGMKFRVESYRCKNCGYLESYARKPVLR